MAEAAQMGHAMVQQALAVGMPWADPGLPEYVNRLGQNLARSSESRQAFYFYVLYDPRANAQAFPGGFVVVTSGVISMAENEAELASVLTHEIAHINACHWRTSPWRVSLFEVLILVPTVALAGPAGIALTSGGGLAAPLARARLSRSAERQADFLGVQYLERAGYDPEAAVKMFSRLELEEARQGIKSGGLLATHPRVSDRRKSLERYVSGLPTPGFRLHDEAEFRQMRKEIQDYDDIYFRATGVPVPGREMPPP